MPARLVPHGPPSRPGRAVASLRRGTRAGVHGLVLAAAGAGARQGAAPRAAEDPERRLVRLIKDMGVGRALELLPPQLARAVRAIRAVARLIGPELGR